MIWRYLHFRNPPLSSPCMSMGISQLHGHRELFFSWLSIVDSSGSRSTWCHTWVSTVVIWVWLNSSLKIQRFINSFIFTLPYIGVNIPRLSFIYRIFIAWIQSHWIPLHTTNYLIKYNPYHEQEVTPVLRFLQIPRWSHGGYGGVFQPRPELDRWFSRCSPPVMWTLVYKPW